MAMSWRAAFRIAAFEMARPGMVLIEVGRDRIVGLTPSMRDRIAAHLHADRIDENLAHGTPPDADVPTSLRAASLTGSRSRRRLAAGLARVVEDATHPSPTSMMRVPISRAEVLSANGQIADLRRALLRPGPVSPRAVAQTRMLLTAGGGPLRGRGGDLAAALGEAIAALDALVDASV